MHFSTIFFWSFRVSWGAKQVVEKLNIWEKIAIDKSAWIKAC